MISNWSVLIVSLMLGPITPSTPEPSKPAERCAQIGPRLERLACFDVLFPPQKGQGQNHQDEQSESLPESYARALASEQERGQQSGFIAAPTTEDLLGYWYTAPALGAVPPRPILMLSCVDEISRVELIMPKALQQSRVKVTVGKRGDRALSQEWQSDETGHVFRSGRGLPSIAFIKSMLAQRDIRLESDNAEVNGLQFNVRGLSTTITPLRRACRW